MRSTKSTSNSSRLTVARDIMHFYALHGLEALRNATDKKALMNDFYEANGAFILFEKTLSGSLNNERELLKYLLGENPYAQKEPATREVIAMRVDKHNHRIRKTLI
jgi:hypothetical protein